MSIETLERVKQTNRLLEELVDARCNGDIERANSALNRMGNVKSVEKPSKYSFNPTIINFKTEIINCRKVGDNAFKKVILHHGLMENYCESNVPDINNNLKELTCETLKNLSKMSSTIDVTLSGLTIFEANRKSKLNEQISELIKAMDTIGEQGITEEERDNRIKFAFELRSKLGE